MSDVWREVWPDARDTYSRARMAYLSDVDPASVSVVGQTADRNLVPFRAIAAPDFSGVADAVWVGEPDEDCPLCGPACISDSEGTP